MIAAPRISFIAVGVAVMLFAVAKGMDTYSDEENCACGTPPLRTLSLINPFRSRAADTLSRTYLESLKAGNCLSLPANLFATEATRAKACNVKYPMRVWSLRSIEDKADVKTFGYVVAYGDSQDLSDPMWISMQQQADRWQIVSMDTWY